MRPILLPVILAIAAMQPVAGWARPRAATTASAPDASDPWERTNRRIFALDLVLDRVIIRPLSKFAGGLTPGPLAKVVHNFLVNLSEPVVIINDLLQARPIPAIRSAFRLVVNTTAGGLGAIDVAKGLGDPAHVNGFGDTLGRWGAVPGPYLVAPVFGPTDVRDLLGTLVDDATLPIHLINYPYRAEVDVTLSVVGGLNQRTDVGKDLEALYSGAADPYASLRSAYLQSREAQIRGVNALPPLPDIEETPAPAAAPADTRPSSTPPTPVAPSPTPSSEPQAPAADPAASPSAPPTAAPASPQPTSPSL